MSSSFGTLVLGHVPKVMACGIGKMCLATDVHPLTHLVASDMPGCSTGGAT